MSKSDAHDMAQKIDWHSTLLVPVPANAASFRQVNVNGAQGLFITTHGNGGFNFGDKPGATNRSNNSTSARETSLVLWSQNDMVYALTGDVASENLLEMSNSIR
jgi:hypothetical protein